MGSTTRSPKQPPVPLERARRPAPAKLSATPVSEPAKERPSLTEARTAPAHETPPAERRRAIRRASSTSLLVAIEAKDVTMDRLVDHLTRLRNARKGEKWAASVSADYTTNFDERLAAAFKKLKSRRDVFEQIIQQLEGAEDTAASARERAPILVRLTEKRKNAGWALVASAAATTDFDTRLSGLEAKVAAERKAAATHSPAAVPELAPPRCQSRKRRSRQRRDRGAARCGAATLPVAKGTVETKPVTSAVPATIEIKHRPSAATGPWWESRCLFAEDLRCRRRARVRTPCRCLT